MADDVRVGQRLLQLSPSVASGTWAEGALSPALRIASRTCARPSEVARRLHVLVTHRRDLGEGALKVPLHEVTNRVELDPDALERVRGQTARQTARQRQGRDARSAALEEVPAIHSSWLRSCRTA